MDNNIWNLILIYQPGRTLQLKCTFQHLHRDMINLQLALAYPAHDPGQGKENNIMLDMGGQWKQLKWADRVAFKHKISLLDQNQSHRRTQDLSSQELTKLDMGFSIPNSAILGSNYVRHNSLLIQIILYLWEVYILFKLNQKSNHKPI